MSRQKYVEALKWRLEDLQQEIIGLRQQIQGIFSEIELKQSQAHHLAELLSAEGVNFEDQNLSDLGQVQVSDVAHDFLDRQNGASPLHYKDITNSLLSQGVLIPGKDPAANLLSHISRDDRFIRVGPGTYALKKWGLEPAVSKKRKSRKRRRKSK